MTRRPLASSRFPSPRLLMVLSAGYGAAILGACARDLPTATEQQLADVGVPQLAPPPSCPGQVNLVITMAQNETGSEAIRGDASATYSNGAAGVVAHTSGANGNLMLSLQNAPSRRYSWVSTFASGESDDRLYTNSHQNPGGNDACGLVGMSNGSTGSAVFEAELLAGAKNIDVIRYGKNCNGQSIGGRVTTTRSADGNTWTITGTSGVHCTKLSGTKLQQSGTTGAFSMTLVRQ